QNFSFRRPAVTVEITGFGVPGGPAEDLEVSDVKQVVLDDPADRIPHVVWPADVGPLFADQRMIARRPLSGGAARIRRVKKVGQAASGGWPHSGFIPLHSG